MCSSLIGEKRMFVCKKRKSQVAESARFKNRVQGAVGDECRLSEQYSGCN